MGKLADQKCVPCKGETPPLSGDRLHRMKNELGGHWKIVNEHHLEKEFVFADFKNALAFTNKIGDLAEKEGHHPDLHLAWGKVRVVLWTHAINGLSESDFILAAKIDCLSQ